MTVNSKYHYPKSFNNKMLTSRDIRNKSKKLYLPCENIEPRFKHYYVETTHGEIMDVVKSVRREIASNSFEPYKQDNNIKGLYSKCCIEKSIKRKMDLIYKNVVKYNDYDLNQIYEKNNSQWQNWCDDVCIYFCYNKAVNNIMIPIVLEWTK